MSTPTGIGSFVLYAEQRLALGPGSRVEGGSIGVRSRARKSDSAQLVVGARSNIGPDYQLIAPSTELCDDVECGRILTDTLLDDGIPLRPEHSFPESAMPSLPLASVTTAGSQDVTVAEGQVSTLMPGSYGDLTVYGSLVLNPGDYTFSAITIGHRATLASAGAVQLSVANYLSAGRDSRMYPLFGQPAGQLTVLIAGSDPATNVPTVSFGEHARIRALVGAPHGTVALADHVRVTGAVTGFAIVSGEAVRVRHQDGFPEKLPGQQGSQRLGKTYGVPAGPGTAPVAGPVPSTAGVSLSIGLPIRDNAGLQALIDRVSDPTNPEFRQHITQDTFNATYGATAEDYQVLRDWSDAAGFTTIATFPNRLLLRVTGTAAQVQQALFVNLFYREREDGSRFIAADRDPSLNLSVPVLEINGLGEALLPVHARINGTGIGIAGSYRADDLRNAYLGVGSSLQALDGGGQQVGIVEFASFVGSDVTGYFNAQLAAQGEDSPLPPPNVTLVQVENPPLFGGVPANSADEANLDVEMVYAMAPGATISVFQGTTGITDRLDSILHRMATFSPPLTVASCSLSFGKSDNSQQAIDQMAAQGVSFFTSSGDHGDTVENENKKMNHQTLVGGTFLFTNPLGPGQNYPAPYYNSEIAWPHSGGGVISDVLIPAYQVGIMELSAAANGGSTTHRNYPDVAMVAAEVEYFTGGSLTIGRGTSFSAPLWAGFTALINQRSLQNNAGLMGFLNPTLYAIGLTRGSTMGTDLYSACFNDIQDGGSNGGFTAVPGYDLVTGLGSPRSTLIYQLSLPAPLQPVSYQLIRFVVGTGGDDLRGDSAASADVLLKNGEQFTVTLKEKDAGSWDNGSIHGPLDFAIPSNVIHPTPAEALSGVRINLIQGDGFGETDDNWDIRSLQVSLFNPGSEQLCQLNLIGTFELQDGSTGLVRLSGSAGSSGVGPSSPIYPAGGADSGC